MFALKSLPQLLAFSGTVLVLVRGLALKRTLAAGACLGGFYLGTAAAFLLMRSYPGEVSFALVRDVVGGVFFLFWGVSVTALYRSTGHDLPMAWWDRVLAGTPFKLVAALSASLVAGAICACRLPAGTPGADALAVLALAPPAGVAAALWLEKKLPPAFAVSPAGLMAAVTALELFAAASIIRLDLFSPLTMKVMKFAHDFVHQFFESLLIPDHLFIKTYLWGYIGLLFGKEIGFWGALVLLFTPVLLVLLAINLERLPQVAHIRQGAQRRKLLAAAIGLRRRRLVIPGLAALVLVGAVYRSLYPSVEYWDPKPIPVVASAAGEIVIPRKGEVELEDGRLHKYLFKKGTTEVRFFILLTPQGKLTVDLDACAICKPDGYGQAEGTVICYYCKTLIPLETVGMPGGCNPVPVQAAVKPDGVHIDAFSLANAWVSTVQATSGSKGGGK